LCDYVVCVRGAGILGAWSPGWLNFMWWWLMM